MPLHKSVNNIHPCTKLPKNLHWRNEEVGINDLTKTREVKKSFCYWWLGVKYLFSIFLFKFVIQKQRIDLRNVFFVLSQRGIESTARRPTQEPFYVVTEAEETPLMEAVTIESPPESDSTTKNRVMRNISEPVIGLQVRHYFHYLLRFFTHWKSRWAVLILLMIYTKIHVGCLFRG